MSVRKKIMLMLEPYHCKVYEWFNHPFRNLHQVLYGPGNKTTQFLCEIPVIRLTKDVKIDAELALPIVKSGTSMMPLSVTLMRSWNRACLRSWVCHGQLSTCDHTEISSILWEIHIVCEKMCLCLSDSRSIWAALCTKVARACTPPVLKHQSCFGRNG